MTLPRDHNVVLNQTQFVHLNRPHSPTTASLPNDEKVVAKHSTSQKLPAIGQPPQAPKKSAQPPSIVARVLPASQLEEPPKLARPESSALAAAFSAPRPDASTSQPPRAVDSTSSTFSAAVPIARESPVVSQAAWLAIRHAVSLRVAVDVDSEGRVTDANALDAANPTEKILASSAVQAARRWRFNPARRNGTPVASTTVVVFEFGNNSSSARLLDESQQATASQSNTVIDSAFQTSSAAVPISRESPVISPAAWSAIRHEVSLRVAVDVNSEGRVTGARALDTSDPIEKLLAPAAEQAAHLWRFNPARRNGTAVASTTVIVFQFGKN
jgi:protein TonB